MSRRHVRWWQKGRKVADWDFSCCCFCRSNCRTELSQEGRQRGRKISKQPPAGIWRVGMQAYRVTGSFSAPIIQQFRAKQLQGSQVASWGFVEWKKIKRQTHWVQKKARSGTAQHKTTHSTCHWHCSPNILRLYTRLFFFDFFIILFPRLMTWQIVTQGFKP